MTQSTSEKLPDGLAALQGKRKPARRTQEPPRNPNQLPGYVPAAAPEPVVDLREPEPVSEAQRAPQAPSKPAPRAAAKAAPAEAQNRLTVYVDDSHDGYMNEARFAGTRQRPKIDVSRSAVVRFALDRLMAEMTAQQVADAIAAKPTDAKAIGRKRR